MTINPLRTRERVVVPDRPKPTKAQKIAAWNRENGICWWCGKPVAASGLGVEYDHMDPRELSANDSVENLYPMHAGRCHLRKTLDEDRPRITKAHHQEKLTRPREKSRRSLSAPPGMKYDWSRGRYVRAPDGALGRQDETADDAPGITKNEQQQ